MTTQRRDSGRIGDAQRHSHHPSTVGTSCVSSHFSGRELEVRSDGGKGGMRSGEEIDWSNEEAASVEAAFAY